jgi:hypothetical protein
MAEKFIEMVDVQREEILDRYRKPTVKAGRDYNTGQPEQGVPSSVAHLVPSGLGLGTRAQEDGGLGHRA